MPFVVTVIMAFMFFALNGRLKDVELGTKLVTIERFLSTDNNFEWAVGQYEELAKSSPSAAIFARLGILYFQLDPESNEQEAVNYLQQAKGYDENYWEIYRSLTYIYTQKGKCKEAIEAGEKATKLNALDANSLNNLAWNYYKCEPPFRNLSKARLDAEKAVRLTDQKTPLFLDTLARVYAKRDEQDRARETLRRAMSIASNGQMQTLKATLKELFPTESLAEFKEARR